MGEVVSLQEWKEENRPHWTGPCVCIECRKEFVAVAPMGVLWVECPDCGLTKGHPKHPFSCREGEALFVCGCGSEALTAFFRSGQLHIMCMACGSDVTNEVLPE